MPRPPKFRRVEFVPQITLFKPAGVPNHELEEVILSIEELEAVRLKDLEGLEQEECSERMQVSRATFQRVLGSARQKIAEALIEGKALKFEGGNYKVAMRHMACTSCGYTFEEPFGTGMRARDMACPKCGQQTVHRGEGSRPGGHGFRHRHGWDS